MRLCFVLFIWIVGFFCVVSAVAQDKASFDAVNLQTGLSLDELVRQLASKRVVFVGEQHDRYDHHLNQLEIIRRLREADPSMAIGVELFQQPFQSQIDDYIAGRISEHELLRATKYYSHGGFDYRLYAPILRYAKQEGIPVRALNVPSSLAAAVAQRGIAGVSEKDRAYLPHSIEPADPAYRERIREAFQKHGGFKPDDFDNFVQAQLMWDEGMAESSAAYLNANNGRRLVILTGAGHVEFGSGIPTRLERRTHASYAIVLNSGEAIEPHRADYILRGEKQELPPAGILNARLEENNGECRIASLDVAGPGKQAGLKVQDVVVTIDGETIKGIGDAKLAFWDKQPGDVVRIEVRRKRVLRSAAHLKFEVKLAASSPGRDFSIGSPLVF